MPRGIVLRHAVGSDRGARPADGSAYAGAHLLAVADEGDPEGRAAAAALEVLRALDAEVPDRLAAPEDTPPGFPFPEPLLPGIRPSASLMREALETPGNPLRAVMGIDAASDRLAALLVQAFQAVDSRLRLPEDPAPHDGGTALTVLLHWNGRLVNASAGGCPFSLLRDGALHQDAYYAPGLVSSLLEDGRITPQEAELPHRRLRLPWERSEARPHMSFHEVRPGDRYLLCTGGLTEAVPLPGVHEVLAASSTPDAAVRRLLALAASEGADGVTCVVADAVLS